MIFIIMKNQLLVLFYRNPVLGKVKTRLAARIGDEKALAVYFLLSHHTKEITTPVACDKNLYYTDFIDTEDNWPTTVYHKSLQHGADLGEKMMHAFHDGFEKKYDAICIIGTDCFELTTGIVESAFEMLKTNDVVIGPAKDGGYYLLGMNRLYGPLFQNKKWSSDSVAASTIRDCKDLNLKVFELPMLTDVDEEKDLPHLLKKII